MKITVERDANGKIITIDAVSESDDGHLSKEESESLNKFLEEESRQEIKRIEENSKATIEKHKNWSVSTSTAFKCLCESIVDYLSAPNFDEQPELPFPVEEKHCKSFKDSSKESKPTYYDPEKEAAIAGSRF